MVLSLRLFEQSLSSVRFAASKERRVEPGVRPCVLEKRLRDLVEFGWQHNFSALFKEQCSAADAGVQMIVQMLQRNCVLRCRPVCSATKPAHAAELMRAEGLV